MAFGQASYRRANDFQIPSNKVQTNTEQIKNKQQKLLEIARSFGGELTPKLPQLEPYREGIAELRARGASFTTITQILSRQLGVDVTRYAVIRYCQQVLEGWGPP